MLASLKARAGSLRTQTFALYLATRDPRTPWAARLIVLLTVAYALSPIDLIPDFIPIVGYLDDLIIVPAGLALALKLIPAQVMVDARHKADRMQPGWLGVAGASIILVLWAIMIIVVFALLRHAFWPKP